MGKFSLSLLLKRFFLALRNSRHQFTVTTGLISGSAIRFFCISSDHIARRTTPADSELLDLRWLTFKQTLDLDLPIITRVVLEELQETLECGPFAQLAAPVPYYYMRNGVFRRVLL